MHRSLSEAAVTAFDIIDLVANGKSLQAYFGTNFVQDSAFPDLFPGDRVIAQPTPGGGLLLQPVDAVEQYPITVDSPPDDLVSACVNGPPEISPAADLDASIIAALATYASPASPDTSSDTDTIHSSIDHEPEHQTQ